MKNALAVLVFLPLSACSCDEPLVPIVAPIGDVPVGGDAPTAEPTPPAHHAMPLSHQQRIEGSADVERAPVVVNTCGAQAVAIAPEVTATVFGEFQSTDGTGVQQPIDVSFTCPVGSVTVTIFDPDFPGNQMIAFDDAVEAGRVSFLGDGSPGVLTVDTETVTAQHITHVQLVPDPADFVSYGELSYL